ncbi:hypothetical protein [Streptomyces sp. NPDC003032]
MHVPPAWSDADAFVRQMPDWFRLDCTQGQEHALYVAFTDRRELTGCSDLRRWVDYMFAMMSVEIRDAGSP